jgi:NADH dehydrogenase [ubiquinone] 1 alpha subcomplex assembly factor 6
MGFGAMPHDSAAYCLEQVRRYDRERYLCALFAPEPARSRLIALYAFNLEVSKVRETVSEALLGQIRLHWWREALAEFDRGVVRAHPIAQAFSAALREAPVRPALLERLLTARELDLDDTPPPTLAALEDYAAGTSASLQQAALDMMGATNEASDRAAAAVGTAWALIGLLRALPFHARQRRLYLPADLLEKEGVSLDALFEGRPGPGLQEVARAVEARAGEHLATARALRREVPKAAMPVLLPAVFADMHRRRLARAGFGLFAPALLQPVPFDALRLALSAWRGRY